MPYSYRTPTAIRWLGLRPRPGARALLGRLAALIGLALARGGRLLRRRLALRRPALGTILELGHDRLQVGDRLAAGLAGRASVDLVEGLGERARGLLAQAVGTQGVEQVAIDLGHRGSSSFGCGRGLSLLSQ